MKGRINESATQRQARKARLLIRINKAKNPPVRTPTTTIAKSDFLNALANSGGLLTKIAERLGVKRETLKRALDLPDWTDMREALYEEIESVTDIAEDAILNAMSQRLDVGTSARTAQWYLQNVKRQKYSNTQTLQVEGGDKPIKTVNLNLTQVDLNTLNLSPQVRLAILEAMDAKDEAETRKQFAQPSNGKDADETPDPSDES